MGFLIREDFLDLERTRGSFRFGIRLVEGPVLEYSVLHGAIFGGSFNRAAGSQIAVWHVELERPFPEKIAIEIENRHRIRFDRRAAENGSLPAKERFTSSGRPLLGPDAGTERHQQREGDRRSS